MFIPFQNRLSFVKYFPNALKLGVKNFIKCCSMLQLLHAAMDFQKVWNETRRSDNTLLTATTMRILCVILVIFNCDFREKWLSKTIAPKSYQAVIQTWFGLLIYVGMYVSWGGRSFGSVNEGERARDLLSRIDKKGYKAIS